VALALDVAPEDGLDAAAADIASQQTDATGRGDREQMAVVDPRLRIAVRGLADSRRVNGRSR
jgi:hypothetical protein